MRCQQIAVCATALAFEKTSVTLDPMCAMAASFTAKIELYIYTGQCLPPFAYTRTKLTEQYKARELRNAQQTLRACFGSHAR